MGETLYRPKLKDGEHLLNSSENPEHYRGLSRDLDNKPGIPELEKVIVESPEEQLARLAAEQDILDTKEQISKNERDAAIANATEQGIYLLFRLIAFLAEHPEIRQAVIRKWNGLKSRAASAKKRVRSTIQNLFSKTPLKEDLKIPNIMPIAENQKAKIIKYSIKFDKNGSPLKIVIEDDGIQHEFNVVPKTDQNDAMSTENTITAEDFDAIVSADENRLRNLLLQRGEDIKTLAQRR